jgi:hypothetical protein
MDGDRMSGAVTFWRHGVRRQDVLGRLSVTPDTTFTRL